MKILEIEFCTNNISCKLINEEYALILACLCKAEGISEEEIIKL